MILEACDQRILAALRCVDAVTGVPLIDPVQVSAAGVKLIRNRRGLYVIQAAPGYAALNDYTSTFSQPPATPPAGQTWPVNLNLQITDPAGCQPTSKTAPLPTPKSEPPPTRSGASFPDWFRFGWAGGASVCSWFVWLVALVVVCS